MIRTVLVCMNFVIVLLFSGVTACATHKPCGDIEGKAAVLSDWKSIYEAYKYYGHCDDGAIAEGYSQSIVHTLATRWNDLSTLNKFVSNDNAFLTFVIRHINSTADEEDLIRIKGLASNSCPNDLHELCILIANEAEIAIKELDRYIKDE